MLIKADTCPICETSVAPDDLRCRTCGGVIQLGLDGPPFLRAALITTRSQPAFDHWREELARHPHSALARYRVGLCYLNYEFPVQGLEEWRQAASRLAERHLLRFELALVALGAGEYALGLEQIQRALDLAPAHPQYLYLADMLRAEAAWRGNNPRQAVQHWIAAYGRLPDAPQASRALRQFVQAHQARIGILSPNANLGLHGQEVLRLWHTNPAHRAPEQPPAPVAPAPLGRLRLEGLRRLAPPRAGVMEQMYADRLAGYQAARQVYEAQQQTVRSAHEAAIHAWQGRMNTLIANLPAMAWLCLAVAEEEARRQAEATRIAAEQAAQAAARAQQRLQQQQARAQQQQAQAAARQRQAAAARKSSRRKR